MPTRICSILACFLFVTCLSAVAVNAGPSAPPAAQVNFVVDGRVPWNVSGGDDMARLRDLLSGVGIGGYEITDWQTKLIKELGIERVQIINAFNNSASRVDGKLEYDWSMARGIALDVIKSGAEPKFVIASSMPRALSSRPDDAHYMSYPPADWGEYEDFIYQAVRYFNVTLAYLGCKAIYWEVQNEPDGTTYWFPEERAGSKVRYDNLLTLYRHTVKAVEKYEKDFPNAPRVKIGGARFTGLTYRPEYSEFVWLERFLKDCRDTKTRVDWVSFHFYGAAASYDGHSNWSPVPSLKSQIANAKRWIKQYSPKTELHITEWGAHEENHTGSRGIVNANHCCASFAAAAIKTMVEGGVDRAFFLSMMDRVNPLSSGLERNVWEMEALCTVDGCPKAIYNAFRAFRKMAPNRVAVDGADRDVDVLASRDADRITVLVWNTNLFGPDAATASAKSAAIEVRGLPNWKNVTCRRYLIDETHSDAYYYRNDPAQMWAHSVLEEIEPIRFAAGDAAFSDGALRLPAQELKPESLMLLEITGESR